MGALLGLRGGAWEWPLRDLQAGCVCPDLCSLGHLNSPSCFSYAHASFKSIFRYLPNAGYLSNAELPCDLFIYLFFWGAICSVWGENKLCSSTASHL